MRMLLPTRPLKLRAMPLPPLAMQPLLPAMLPPQLMPLLLLKVLLLLQKRPRLTNRQLNSGRPLRGRPDLTLALTALKAALF